ncbi:MAG: methionyl-tRNA formyltransferase, partial [Phycisphaerales bacterium]
AQDHTITAIVTQPDRKAGRGSKLTATPIGQWASEHLPDAPLIKPENINTDAPRDLIRSFPADAWIIIAYGQYLGQKLLTDRFAINLHASRLPRWRGASPINSAIIAGDTTTGNSVITIDKQMDAGAILAQSTRTIEPDMTAAMLHDALAHDGPDLVAQVLDDRLHNREQYLTQDPSQITIASKMSKADGVVDFNQPARLAAARINGLNPWPSVTVGFREENIKINQSKPADFQSQQAPGTIIDADSGLIACGDAQSIQLLKVQPAGKRAMDWKAFANGRSIESGEQLLGSPIPTPSPTP